MDRMIQNHHDTLHGNGDGELGLMATVTGIKDWQDSLTNEKKLKHTDRIMIICALIGVFALLGIEANDRLNPKPPSVIYVTNASQLPAGVVGSSK